MYRYEDAEAQKRHVAMPHFKAFFKALQTEGLLAEPAQILAAKAFSGYDVGRAKL